ncbi:unnamed protein product, partial [Effrenium voratum]
LAGTYLANPFQLKPEDFDPREFFSEGPRETPKVDSEPKQSDAEPDGKANYEELLALLRQQSEEAKANVAMCAKTLQQTQEQHQKMFSEMQKALQQLTQPKSTKPQTMELSALRPNDAAWAGQGVEEDLEEDFDPMERNVGHALQMFVKVVSQKEGKSEEEVLQELSTPAGMEMFAKMLSTSASGAVGSLKKTKMLATSCERINIYLEAINKHCPWLMEETEEEHGCGFTDCKGESQRLFFGLDLASANAFYPSRFTMCLPKVRWYASEHLADGSYLGTKMMDDCLEYMTTAPEEEPRKRPRRETVDLLGVEDGVQKGEDDESEGGDSDASELEEFLTSLGTNDSREAAKLLRGRAACVDVTEETWHTVEHLQGRCSVVTCTSLLTQVGYMEPHIWTDVLHGANDMLEEGGILIMYDSEKWGDFANVEKTKEHLQKQNLALQFLERKEPVDFSGDPDGRMFVMVFKKTRPAEGKGLAWLLQKAEDLKHTGNSFYTNTARHRAAQQKPALSSSPKVAALWKAVGCYVQALDCFSLARAAMENAEHECREQKEQLRMTSSRLYSNLAAAYLELAPTAQTYHHAMVSINLALTCDPEWDKAQERKAKIQAALAKRSADS